MSKKIIFIGLIAIMAVAFIVVRCGKEQKNPMEPIQTTAKIQADDPEYLGTGGASCADNDPSDRGVIPVKEDFPGGDPQCAGGVRVTPGDGPQTIVQNLDGIPGNDVTVVITVGDCGEVMSWSVPDNIIIDVVYAKGGKDQNVYTYTTKYSSDGNLHCPLTSSGKYAGFSHIDFCFHYRLTISKTAVPEYTRDYSWTIDKVGDQTELTLAVGETYIVNYDVTVDASYTDRDWKVMGTITIFNNTPYEAEITSITDVADGVTATVDCALPYTLAAGATLNCNYSADLSGAINGTNTVTVVTSTPKVEGGTATKDYAFGAPTTEFDECITVTDDQYGSLGTVCQGEAPKLLEYPLSIVYDACGDYGFVNVASFVTNDNGVTGSDSWTVLVHVPCGGGCTLTAGYWKTHSQQGPAPYDDAWALLGPLQEKTIFFLSGQTYYQVLWTPPAGGNAYYILAHQYIAAKLNMLNGASSTPEVDAAMAWATNFFNTYKPSDKLSKIVSNQAKSYADLLDQYNNGLIGPGHCSE
ncbi:MAG: hypothetical protein ONB13_13365 [candidate division KSB1 bacterium]|nr:hypothetical protein [candidate division KSB1 bacterium]